MMDPSMGPFRGARGPFFNQDFFPRLFLDNEILLQTEYRQANKNSDLVLDFSLNNDESGTKRHIFLDIESNKENKEINFHVETVSNDTYLKQENIESSIHNDSSLLYSYLNYSSIETDSSLEISLEAYEDLNKNSFFLKVLLIQHPFLLQILVNIYTHLHHLI